MAGSAGFFAYPRGLVASSRARTIAYWVATVIMAWEMFVGGAWDILRIPYVYDLVVGHLGYPDYFPVLIGIGKVLAGVAMLAPRFPRLKEWAYAGAFFTYLAAVASALAVGDGPDQWAGPAGFGLICLVSWGLRPSSRRDLLPR